MNLEKKEIRILVAAVNGVGDIVCTLFFFPLTVLIFPDLLGGSLI